MPIMKGSVEGEAPKELLFSIQGLEYTFIFVAP